MGKKSTVSQGKVYVVEDILDTKIINGLQHFRVKWKGYSFSECTWEPEESFNCSRQILNQFLLARAQKQPSFKDKLQKISKDNEPIIKDKVGFQSQSNERKLLKHNQTKNSLEKSNQKTEIKKEQEPNSQEENINVKYGYQLPTNKLAKEESKPKLQPQTNISKSLTKQTIKTVQIEDKENRKIKTQSVNNRQKDLRSQPQKIESQKTNQSDNSKPGQKGQKKLTQKDLSLMTKAINNQQTSLRTKKQFKILSIKCKNNALEFVVMQDGQKKIMGRQEMHKKYSIELCRYYENFITFDD